jgi:hypothetical protein
MKKFYSAVLLFVGLIGAGYKLDAQTYVTVPAGGDIVNASTWVGGVQPPLHSVCNNCTIYINGPVVDNLYDINFAGNSTIYITNGSTLVVNAWVELGGNTAVIVESNALLVVNDEIDLSGNAYVQLSDGSAAVNANNDGTYTGGTSNPITGPIQTGDITYSGIYVNARGAYASTNPTDYNFVLSQYGVGNPLGYFINNYTINCSGVLGCATGVINGPAKTVFDVTYNTTLFEVSAPLPVTLVKFTAQAISNQSVLVSWTTAQETNSSYYNVERSADGANWVSLGNVNAKGFSNVATDYTFNDKAPLSGTSYYRLKMVDRDASFKYSKVIPVTIAGNTQALVIYSNPFVDQIRLKVNVGGADNLNLILTDMQGRTYLTQSYQAQPGDNFINLQPVGAAAGLYMLSIQGNTYSQTVKIMKQ